MTKPDVRYLWVLQRDGEWMFCWVHGQTFGPWIEVVW